MQRLVPGLVLSDRFSLVRELGNGGMGSVWLAEDRQFGERVALKILDSQLAASAKFIALLREESRKARRLDYPNIVRVYDFFQTPDWCFISMQFIDGPTLSQRGIRQFQEIVICALSLCDAIEYAHRAGIIHRDIKPGNVLCDESGNYFLTDFGIACTVTEEAQAIRIRGGGSLPSMSPQQLDGEPACVADDIYALGALLFESLSGAPLFHPEPTAKRIRQEIPPEITVDRAGREIPVALQKLVQGMLDKDPGRRPAGIAAVRSVLEEVRHDYPVEEPAAEPIDAGTPIIRPQRRAGPAQENLVKQGVSTGPAGIRVNRRGLSRWMVPMAFLVLVIIAVGVVFLLPEVVERRGAVVNKPALRPEPQRKEAAEDAVAVNPAIMAAQRARADEVLGELLTVEEHLRAIGIERWGGDDWSEARRLAEAGDAAYRERNFVKAVTNHRMALDRMQLLESRSSGVFSRAMRDAQAALLARHQDEAVKQFEIALSIRPEEAEAKHGLQRAMRLDRVLAFMNQAAEAERNSNWIAAESSYRQALELDGDWDAATEGLKRVQRAIADARFEKQMAAGFSAVESRDHERARQAFRAALKTRPGNEAALEALRQVDVDQKLERIVELRVAARIAEAGEDWPEAVRRYNEILAIDPQIEAIGTNRQHARERAKLSDDLDQAIAAADRFYEDKIAKQATAVLQAAQSITAPGPVLSGQIARLDQLLRIASTPVPVSFVSDNLTDVVIYKVGRLGIFSTRTIDLKPGLYQAVGTRDGYRDVRRRFRVVADGEMEPISVSCEETI